MANFVIFQMHASPAVKIYEDDPLITQKLIDSTVQSITVVGDPWVLFDSQNYGGDFKIYKEGNDQPFPKEIKGRIIESVRKINGGIHCSQVTLYPHPFFKGVETPFQSQTPQLQGTYFSLKVAEGAVIFFDNENYTGAKRILLKGDEVQNFTAVKLTSIGKSMKTAWDMGPK